VFKEIYALNYNQLKVESLWPEEFRPIRQQFLNDWRRWTEKDQASYGQSPSTSDVALQISPRFYVVKDGNLVQTAAGIGGWKTFVVPTLDRVAAVSGTPAIRGPSHLDGNWTVVQICQDQPQAKGYELRFNMVVRDGYAHGQYGQSGTPASHSVSGQIGQDGVVEFSLEGLTGPGKFNIGGAPENVPYRYTFPARFSGSEGKGVRTQGRPCTFLFKKL